MRFHELLKRHLDGRTAVWLAAQTGAHEQSVRRWLTGGRVPGVTGTAGRASDLRRICDALRLPEDARRELAAAAGFDVLAPHSLAFAGHAPESGAPSAMESE